MIKVKVFVDYANLRGRWREAQSDRRIIWENLPQALVKRLEPMLSLATPAVLDFRGVTVYASIHPERPDLPTEEREKWLRNKLDQKPGFTVKIYKRHLVEQKCRFGHVTKREPERGVDTKIACDMVALAMRGLYDVAVLLTDDSDIIPAVETVQDLLDKQIVHLGFSGRADPLRSACWSHLKLDSMLEEITEPIAPPPPNRKRAEAPELSPQVKPRRKPNRRRGGRGKKTPINTEKPHAEGADLPASPQP